MLLKGNYLRNQATSFNSAPVEVSKMPTGSEGFVRSVATVAVTRNHSVESAAYRIVDLGLPPGAVEVRATAINNRGEVLAEVPYRITQTPDKPGGAKWINGHAYLWREGRFIDFGELDGTDMLDDPLTTDPTALNDRSVAVGTEGTGGPIFMSGRKWVYPFVWRGRGMVRLAPGQTNIPRAINVRGDIVGGDHWRGWAMLDGKV